MEVVTSKHMSELESSAYQKGFKEEDFMEAAGRGVAFFVDDFIKKRLIERKIFVVSGKGNNGGDAYVAAHYLHKSGYEVIVYQIGSLERCSPLCQLNCSRLRNNGVLVQFIDNAEDVKFFGNGMILDGIFGTGLKQAPKDLYAAVIKKMNASQLPIFSIDIPSGLDGNTGVALGETISATITGFLGLPKIGFFFADGWNHVGKLKSIDFGLPLFQNVSESGLEMLQFKQIQSFFPKMRANRHKYQAGSVVGLAGSPGMAGAANLSCFASLKGGAGIVKLYHPAGMEPELSGSMYELIKIPYLCDSVSCADEIAEAINKASAVFVGPGLGRSAEVASLLRAIFLKIQVPSVIDADALNLIAQEDLAFPKNCVITPHTGEMRRLLKMTTKVVVDRDFLKICQNFVEKHQITLILKGGPSFVLSPFKSTVVIPYGDPGMATAGSGDVLTGLVSALLAQGLDPHHAALAATALHAYAGECAAKSKTSYCMTASDIVEHFHAAFAELGNYSTSCWIK